MKIGIIGSGNVGRALGAGWARAGHAVFFGVRDPQAAASRSLEIGTPGVRAVIVREAAAAAEVVVLATPWEAAKDALEAAGPLGGKILLDATNPLTARAEGLALPNTTSGGEEVSRWSGGARVVKIFNTIGFNVMENPRFPEGAAHLLYCGDDEDAKQTAASLARDLGFDPVDLGPLSEARLLEPFALVWIHLALFRGQGREIAFRLMRR